MSSAASETLEKVAGEFETEGLAALQHGRGEALAMLSSTRRAAADEVAKIIETGERQAESLRRQIIGAAELDARNSELKSMEVAVIEVFKAATENISKMSGARMEKSLATLIAEGIDVIGTTAKVWVSERDRKAASSAVKNLVDAGAKLAIGDKGVETIGGAVLTSPDGSIRFDNTVESRLERMRPVLRKEVAAMLGGN